MTILVTGATGFVGAHVVAELLRRGHAVRAFSRCRGPDDRIEWIVGDIRDLSTLTPACQGIDAAIHLACVPVGASQADPFTDLEINSTGTLTLLEACRTQEVQRVVYASSAEVYGAQSVIPIREDAIPRPMSAYGCSKLAGEHYVGLYGRRHGLKTTVLRLFNLYGPTAADDLRSKTVDEIFVKRFLASQDVTVTAHPATSRDLLHVTDAARALCATVERQSADGVLNIGTGVETSIVALASLIRELTGSAGKILLTPETQASRSCADITAARRSLGFEPMVSLEEGLRRTIALARRYIAGQPFSTVSSNSPR